MVDKMALTAMYQNDILFGMATVTPFPRPIRWDRLPSDQAELLVRNRALVDGGAQVVFTDHTWDRVSERDITRADIMKILTTGHCLDIPKRNQQGHWQCIMVKRIAGKREAGAVTIILERRELLIIRTVEWMDPR